jgi:hypothetical protein
MAVFITEVCDVLTKHEVSAKAQLMGKQMSFTNGATDLVSGEELITY